MMQTDGDILHKYGIVLRAMRQGNQKTKCPKCSHLRKNKREPCLSVLIDSHGVQFNCFNCGFHGGEFYDGREDFGPARRDGFQTARDSRRNSRSLQRLYR